MAETDMKAKWRLEECRSWNDLTASEDTQRNLQQITQIEVQEAVQKKVNSKDFDLGNDPEATLARAYFVGAERGMRIGRPAAIRMISEAREFARLQLANNAPWLGEVEAEEDD